MIVLYESIKDIDKDYDCDVEPIFEHRDIYPGEAVGIYISNIYSPTIRLIESLLYRKTKSNITIKYKGKVYHLSNPIDWKHTHQDEHDQIKQVTERHPILEEYLAKRRDYYASKNKQARSKQYEKIASNLTEVPDEEKLIDFLRTFAPLYQVDVDYTDKIQMMRCYLQIQWYLDNDIEYANDIKCIDYHDELMFQGMFEDSPESIDDYQILLYNIGNEELFDDLKYKCEHDCTNVDKHIQNMLQLDCI